MPSAGIPIIPLAFPARHAHSARGSPQKENHMSFRKTLHISAIAAYGLAFSFTGAVAQQTQHVSFKSPAENSKYTEQHVIDVGDVPGHQVRVYEIHRTYPANQPVISGLKLTESWTRATSDYINGMGTGNNYAVYVVENGDKFFVHSTLVAQSKGTGKLTATVSGVITGGTGKLSGISGVVQSVTQADPKAGFNENQSDIDYSIGK
jgi:hypothetical protein